VRDAQSAGKGRFAGQFFGVARREKFQSEPSFRRIERSIVVLFASK
jgi:hypothetical protein